MYSCHCIHSSDSPSSWFCDAVLVRTVIKHDQDVAIDIVAFGVVGSASDRQCIVHIIQPLCMYVKVLFSCLHAHTFLSCTHLHAYFKTVLLQ